MVLVVCVAGHLVGPVLCHSFCNYMGFPAISTALEHPQRILVLSSYLLGVLLFLLFLFPFTDPSFYSLPTPVCSLASSPSSLCGSWSRPAADEAVTRTRVLFLFFSLCVCLFGERGVNSRNSHVDYDGAPRILDKTSWSFSADEPCCLSENRKNIFMSQKIFKPKAV